MGLFFGLAAGCSYAQSTATFEINAGYTDSFIKGVNSQSYFNLRLRGMDLITQGTKPQFATHLDLAGDQTQKPTNTDWLISLENGSLSSGGLLKAIVGKKLDLPVFTNLRGSAYFGGSKDFRNLTYAVGLETPQYPVPLFSGLPQVANWLAVGVQAQRSDTNSGASHTDTGVLTVRAFVGKNLGVPSIKSREARVPKAQVDKLVAGYLKLAPSAAEGKKIADGPHSSGAESIIAEAFQEGVGGNPDASLQDWKAALAKVVTSDVAEDLATPVVALFSEYSGYSTFAGKVVGDKAKGLFTASADWWLVPARDDMFLRFRYENGFERAAPTERKNHLIITLGFNF